MQGYLFLFFYYFHYYLYLFIHLVIYTPLYEHFKAFPVSKINYETNFLYQLFKENSNFIVKKSFKVICLILMMSLIFIFIYMYIYTQVQINILKPSQCLKSIMRQVFEFWINFSRKIQILLF